MRCWGCRGPILEKTIDRHSILRGRAREKGGPYRVYRCPRCLAENKVEENGRGQLFASPPKEISLLDYLFGWIEPLAPEDFLKIVEWQEECGEARRVFFEAGGDRRYSGGPLRRLLRRVISLVSLRGRRPPTAERSSPRTHAPESAREGPTEAKSRPRPRAVPHPYRILGVSPEASEEEIRAAFRDLARRWHPDKQRDPADVEEATRRWQELMRAYESISARRAKE